MNRQIGNTSTYFDPSTSSGHRQLSTSRSVTRGKSKEVFSNFTFLYTVWFKTSPAVNFKSVNKGEQITSLLT